MEAVSVIFVLSKELDDESQASEVMLQAFEACKQNKVNTLWVKEQDIPRKELKKTDFIVFENFEGQDFEGIKEAKSAILGPWCILVCLMEGKKIPNFQWPIYNVAMYDCIVTSSHLPKSMKSKIDEMVQRMGGYYNDSLSESTTHLITDSVKSAKYMRAIEMNIKVLTPSWIDAVWEASQEANIHCNDKQFDKFKCPPLHKLIICTTGISSMKEREEVRRLVTENGGEFTAKLNLKKTDFLICDGAAGAMSEKYKQARKTSNVTCVTLQWLHDSIQKGYCVPHEDYVVQKGTSTPQKPDFINPDFSTMSAIDQSKCDRTSVEESVVHNPTYNSASHSSTPTSGAKRKVFAECDNLIEQIDIKKAKKSGQFLDGFSIYLVGFKDDHREKLCKIINASGATRCDDMSDRVTHVIVGDPESHELKIIKSKGFTCFIVTIQWLLDSIDRKRPCGEDPYLVNNLRDESKFKSPMGKKGLSLLRSKRTITEIDLTLSQKEKENLENEMDAEAEKEIMKQYMMPEPTAEEDTLANILKNANFDSERLGGAESDSQNKQHADAPSTEETYTSQTLDQPLDIFRGFSFFITGFDEEQVTEMEEKIQSASGRITNVFRDANYVVAPCFISDPLDYDENITINDLWIYDCITEEQILPIAYYHRPLHVVNPTVLEDCVVTVSGYMGYERNFLSSLIVMLGGVSQEQFCRITSVERNVLGSTHLVIAEAKGKKYAGAVKWRLPAVTQDWLVGCARSEVRLPERDYLVSDAGSKIDSSVTSSKLETASKKENTSNPQSVSMEYSKISARDVVPQHLLEFNKDYYNVALGITANTNSTGVSLKDTPGTSSRSSDSDKIDLRLEDFSKPSRDRSDERNVEDGTKPSGSGMEEPMSRSSRKTSVSSQKGRALGNSSLLSPINSGMNDSDLPSSSVVRVETPKVTSEDSFTIPPPRPVNMGRRDSRSQRSRDPFKTPDRMEDDLPYSQVTPVEKIMNAVRMTNLLGTPESPQVPRCAWDVDTPDTPYGICFDPNPSRSLKKRMLRFINSFPDKATPPAKRRVSTPLSELKRRLWDKIGSNLDSQSQSEDPSTPGRQDSQDDEENESEKVSCTQSELVNTKLKQLEEIMTAVGGSANKSRRQKEADFVLETACDQDMRVSQPCTVQWDFGKDTQEEPSPESKVFMISGVGDPNLRSKIVSSLKELGATVSETSSYDPSATHLLCPKPARNEKTLSCMAAGKWILHIDYVDACLKASKFVNEEYYEFGNPNSIGKISIELDRDIEIRMQAIHYWRNELARTGRGPFQDMRTIIVAEKKQALVSVIEAGGGTVIEATPPFDDTIHATHCLMEPKSVSNFALYEPLARQGIYCVNTLYLSDFLHRTNKDIKDAILPFYQKYFR
ncbi:DNA topoisomerase 2-binding protein 1-A isoform X2 [Coccinella septempunctata]|uniref:DNA topoisomerase 2-binding protein 1-A isoform X2 n=1 Tax=Coccinella septempunctata TaxID=41139 RepID=UPI001D099837|nr:DNA topoisomerase 2-binding protein 1-A isoform X2 [Coccinella septempunctata]